MTPVAVCLLCGTKRLDTSAGRVPCACRLDRAERGLGPVVVAGIGGTDPNGRVWIIQPCGRVVYETRKERA